MAIETTASVRWMGRIDRILRPVGELVDRLDLGLDVGEEDGGVPALGHLEGHDADVLARLGADLLDVLDASRRRSRCGGQIASSTSAAVAPG